MFSEKGAGDVNIETRALFVETSCHATSSIIISNYFM